MSNLVKVTVNLTEDNFKTVEALAASTNTNKTDIINKAIIAEKFLVEARAAGKKILIKDKDGSIQEVIFR